jgi:2-methylcitrate dehydratase PrpD
LEGKAGFFSVYVRAEPPSMDEVAGLPDAFHVEQVSIKQYPSCGSNHRATQAAIQLAREEDLSPGDVKEVDLWLGENDVWFVGSPFEIGDDPQVDAQFNASYAVALGLLRRKAGLTEYAPDSVRGDREVTELAQRVRVHQIEGTEGKLTNQVPVTLKVVTSDGRELERTVFILKGSPADPMTYEEAAVKFRGCADFAGHWEAKRVEAIVAAVDSLDDVSDVGSFVSDLLVK